MTSTPDPFTYPQDSYPGSSPSGVQPYDPVAQGGYQGGYQGGFQQQAYQDPAAQAGYAQPGYDAGAYAAGAGAYVADQKSKVAAGLLGIFLGCFGAHNFYLGYTGKAVAQLLITLLSLGFLAVIPAIWALIEGILILSAQPGAQPWGVDARGVPLSS